MFSRWQTEIVGGKARPRTVALEVELAVVGALVHSREDDRRVVGCERGHLPGTGKTIRRRDQLPRPLERTIGEAQLDHSADEDTRAGVGLVADDDNVATRWQLQHGVGRVLLGVNCMSPNPRDASGGSELDAEHALDGRTIRLDGLACHYVGPV